VVLAEAGAAGVAEGVPSVVPPKPMTTPAAMPAATIAETAATKTVRPRDEVVVAVGAGVVVVVFMIVPQWVSGPFALVAPTVLAIGAADRRVGGRRGG
jgi:hypothetical protein